MNKIIATFLLIFISFITSAYLKPSVYKIDAEQNAIHHNNMAQRYVQEGNYYAAAEEYKIAISLNPNSQASAVYYNNLGEIYLKFKYYKAAQDCFERAINQYNLNLLYYQNLAKCYKGLKLTDFAIKKYTKQTKNPLNMVLLGLLYIEKGDIKKGIIKLDEFCMQEPQLILSGAVRNYIKTLLPKIQ